MNLNMIWFLLVGVLLIGYAILDGFDFGVGVLHLFSKGEQERRININAIGPVCDGNEVWLLTGGGALFAAFPLVYATVFSGFYLALMLLLVALILRAVSLEFRNKVDSPAWRALRDWAFGIGSILPAVLFGVALGNILRSIPIDANSTFRGSFLGLLNPYAILVGLLSFVGSVMHGALYLTVKTEGEQRQSMVRWVNGTWIAFVVLYLVVSVATFFSASFLFQGLLKNPIFWVLLTLLLLSILYIPVAVKAGRYFVGLLASSATIAAMIGLAALSLFPRGSFESRPCVQPDGLQCVFYSQDPGDHAGHRSRGHAYRAGVHDPDLSRV
ncbi:MAG TPA: cytochrome d ubiquinol oxidase subunit II [Candidatus Eremiobacteraceae bacterium]|nr:cytochrome d ubiquinol oxidase subunit II [Candidatus Eremiobacteraceae bacterium]